MNKKRIEELLDIELNSDNDTPLGKFVQVLVVECMTQKVLSKGEAMAASFDLLVGLFYYEKIIQKGWIQCPNGEPHYFFPYVNACPRCVLEEKFIYHKAGKGQSANIGQASVKALIFFVKEWFKSTGYDLNIFQGEEPVDLVVFDRKNNSVFLAEVKSAPLFTLPLAIGAETNGEEIIEHDEVSLAAFKSSKMGLMVPIDIGGKWEAKIFYFSKLFDGSENYFIDELLLLVSDKESSFLTNYFLTWKRAFHAYANKVKTDNIFWLTGGCGKPSSKLWTQSTSISDGKTSVGMDRTDDIKKGVYQLLKLRLTDVAKETDIDVKVGIFSNAHAARHYEDYIQPIQNVMWLKTDHEARTIDDLPVGTPVYNLYDGLITFTQSYSRDSWLKEIFNFNS